MATKMQSMNHNTASFNMFKVLILSSILTFLAGCVTVTDQVDLEDRRRVNLASDLEEIRALETKLPAGEIGLDEAIELAMRNNFALRVTQFEAEMAKDNAYAERLEMLPDLNASARYSYRDRTPRQDYIDASTGEIQNSNTIGNFRENKTADLSLTWSVLDFGLSYYRSRQAQLAAKSIELQRIRQAQLLALDVTEAYWRAALAEDALDYVRQLESELSRQKEMIQLSVRERRIDPIAAKDATKRLVQLQIIIRDLQAEVSTARINLSNMMGLQQQYDYQLRRDPIRPILAGLPRPEQLNVPALEQYALTNRPELYQQDLTSRIREDDVRSTIASMFPDLTFGIGASYDDNRLLNANHWNNAAATIGFNLLSLPSKFARMDAAEDSVDAAKYERLATTVGVMAQTNLAVMDYAVKIDRFLLREESYTLANDLLTMVQASNRAGRVSDLAVTQRVLEDVAEKLKRDRSVVEAIVAYRRMLASVGMPVYAWNTNIDQFALLNTGAYTADGVDGTRKWVNQQLFNEQVVYIDGPTEVISVEGLSAFPWTIQVGAYYDIEPVEIEQRRARALIPRLIENNPAVVTTRQLNGRTAYRARYMGFTQAQARHACGVLKKKGMDCWVDQHTPNRVVSTATY